MGEAEYGGGSGGHRAAIRSTERPAATRRPGQGAAGGAAVGAAVGAIAGDAGKGAAAGAVTGTVVGGTRQRRSNQAAAEQQQAGQQQASQQMATFNRAVAACMTGRGIHSAVEQQSSGAVEGRAGELGIHR
ncbi:YMGG-like glycine zipper-containing protein [Cupriavidus basilensis]